MSVLFLDVETFHGSENLKVCGTYRYALDAEVMLAAWAWNDDLPTVWDFTDCTRDAKDLQALIDEADEVVVHNSSFERIILREQGVTLPFEKIDDTAVIALQHGLVKDLDRLCSILGVPESESKLKEGKKLITLFCSPCPKNWKLRRATRESHPEEWARFKVYAGMDIVSMREVRRRLPRWNCTPLERRYFELDQRINDRGFKVDTALATSATAAFRRLVDALAIRTKELTGGVIGSVTEVAKLVEYLQAQGLTLFDMTKDTVEGLLLRDDIRPDLRELLEIRQQASRTTPSKFKALMKAMSPADERLRGTLQFCGAARTGRDAGRIFQPQNLIRTPDWFDEAVQELVVCALKLGIEDLLWEDIADRVAYVVRGCLIAEEGCRLVAADLSNIEGRGLAWLADEEWKLKAFADYDRGIGEDIYKITAGRILKKLPVEVTKAERQQYGKVSELSCLGPDTQVLTDHGTKRITEVSTKDMLWDGVEWVGHQGLVSKGHQRTFRLDGLALTPDHRVLAGETWLPAKMVSSYPSFRDLAWATGRESLRSLASSWGREAVSEQFARSAPAGAIHTPSISVTGVGELLPAATAALRMPARSGEKITGATLPSALTMLTGGVCSTASQPASTDVTTPTTAPSTATVGAASGSMSLGGETEHPSSHICSPSKGGTSPSSSLTASKLTKVTNPETSASLPSALTEITSDEFETCSVGSMTWKPVYDIAHAGPRNRFTVMTDHGAFIVHNCGYQGSVGAFRKMGGAMAEAMTDDEILEIVRPWRAEHPRTKNLWYDTEKAARAAVNNPGEEFVVGKLAFDCVVDVFGLTWLRMRLPSGRYLCYLKPSTGFLKCPVCDGEGVLPNQETGILEACFECDTKGIIGDGRFTYEGVDQKTKQWGVRDTYGGSFIENACQAVARDIFFHGLEKAEQAGYPVVLRVHDELVAEVPIDGALTADGLAACMTILPRWAMGLPLAAAGFEAYRYRKD